MTMLTILLQAAAPQPAASGGMSMILMLVLLFGVMYFLMIRPQRKQQKELQNFRDSLKKGDKVVTAGGIFGTIHEIQDKSVLIKVDGEVKLRVDKNSILRDFTDSAK